jgi:hypothetical protein
MKDPNEIRAQAVIISVWLVLSLLWLRPGLLVPDGAGYFSYLPSVYFGGDLLLFDEWGRTGQIRDGRIFHKEITSTSHLGNHWTVGASLFWAPAYVFADMLAPVVSPRSSRDGFSLPYNVAAVSSSAFLALLTLLVGFKVLRRLEVQPYVAAASALAVLLGTPLLWYGLQHATMAHAAAAFSTTAAVAIALRLRDEARPSDAALCGILVGLSFSVRPQNAIIVIVPLIVAGAQLRTYRAALLFGGGGLLGAMPQLIVSFWLYGNPLGFVSLSRSGDPGRAWRPFEKVWIFEPLFSWYHGLFTWSPITIAALVGLVILYRKNRPVATAGIVIFLLQWVINATLERTFWGATAFGQRRSDVWTVFAIMGIAALMSATARTWMRAAIAAAAAWTLLLFMAAASGALDLRSYRSFTQTAAAIANTDFSLLFKLLAFVPGRAVPAVLAVFLLTVIVLVLIAFGWSRLRMEWQTTMVAAYLVAISAMQVVAGARDDARLPEYEALIRVNRELGVASGGTDTRMALLADEIDFLRRTGRAAEAEAASAELVALQRRRAAALERAIR